MRNQIKYIIFAGLSVLFSCDKNLNNVSCDDCIPNEIPEIQLEIEFDNYRDNMYQVPEIIVYEGNIEDGIIVGTRVSQSSPVYFKVYINKKYTVAVTYYYYGNKYIAVGSVFPKYVYDNDKCDHPCYFLKNNKITLHLKYT